MTEDADELRRLREAVIDARQRIEEAQKLNELLSLRLSEVVAEQACGRNALFRLASVITAPWGAQPLTRRLAGLLAALLRGRLKRRLQEDRDVSIIARSGAFDGYHYLNSYPDVAAAAADPLVHYVRCGAREGRFPHPQFDSRYYLDANPDVRRAGMNPLAHYVTRGAAEGRRPNAWIDLEAWVRDNSMMCLHGLHPLLTLHAPKDGDTVVASGRAAGRRPPRGTYGLAVPDSERARLDALLDRYEFDKAAEAWQRQADAVERIRTRLATLADHAPTVSIIVPVHNQLRHTLACIESILTWSTRHSFEIIVGNDGSTDGTETVLSGLPPIRVVSAPQASGFVDNCNRTAATARGHFVVLLNNDTVVLPGWLDALIDTFDRYPEAGLVGCKLIYPDGRLQEAGGVVWADGSGLNFGRFDDPDLPPYNHVRAADYCSGAAIAIPTGLWRRLGGFDDAFAPAYYEDTDIAFRIRQAGHAVLYQPHAAVIHFEGVSCGTSEDDERGLKRFQRINRGKFHARWAPVLASHGTSDDRPAHFAERDRTRRVLVLDATTPTPNRDSGSADTVNFMRLLRRQGWHVTFIPADLVRRPDYTAAMEEDGIECRGLPHAASLEAAVEALAPTIDACLIFRVEVAARVLKRLRAVAPRLPVVFHTVDLHHLREMREAELAGDAELARQAEETRRREAKCIRDADISTVVSVYEMDVAQRLVPGARIRQLPLVRDMPEGPFPPFSERDGVLFLGMFAHRPNQDAIHYLIDEIWPRARRLGLKTSLYIAGSGVPAELARPRDGVQVLGHVADLGVLFSRYRVSVAPLRFGAGLKGKVIDSLRHKVPVVGTPIAVEGSGFVDGRHLLVGQDADALAAHIVRLHENAALWTDLSEQGHACCRQTYSMEAVGTRLTQIMAEACAART